MMTQTRSTSALHWPVAGLAITAFILLLISTLSVPYVKSLYLVRTYATSISGSLSDSRMDIGVFGICGKGLYLTNTAYGSVSNVDFCSRAELGYELYASSSLNSGIARRARVIPSSLSTALVTLPLSAAFAGLATIFAAIAGWGKGKRIGWWTLASLTIAVILGWIGFGVSAAIVGLTRWAIREQGSRINGISVATRVGGTMPLVLVAAIALSTAFALNLIALLRDIRLRRKADSYSYNSSRDQTDLMRSNTATSDRTATHSANGARAYGVEPYVVGGKGTKIPQ